MILLDTNVLSEPMRAQPAPEAIAWVDAQLSSITVAEILYGSARMPDGKRKQGGSMRLRSCSIRTSPAVSAASKHWA